MGGNPLALQELVRLGSPAEVAEKVVLTGTAPLSLRLREAFAERTRELPESARTVLLVAAAKDSGHTGTVLAAARRPAVDEQALDLVEAAGYLEEVSGARLPFRHPLVRATVYADASARRRAPAHCTLADESATVPRRVGSASGPCGTARSRPPAPTSRWPKRWRPAQPPCAAGADSPWPRLYCTGPRC
ncbi:hypothetical protein [Streptomyces sp. SAI-170]|uniref:hypothetical protein n=1 Tax=Streptomyces sp. SAI-170 TaxID=3377729 RepID=UPI003C7B3623